MDYEKAYKEALERADTLTEKYGGRDFAEYVFPELAESEDERIRKVIYILMLGMRKEIFTTQDEIVTKEKVLAYLEKQKPMYNLEIPAGDVAPAEEEGPFDEDEFLDNELSAFLQNYDKEYDDDAAVSDVARHFYEIGKKQKEQKHVQTEEEREYVKVLKSLISDFIRDNYKTTDISFYQQIYDWLDGRHIEQKLAENPFDANETMKMKDRIDEGFTKMMMQEQKPAECGCTNNESEYDRGYRDGHKFGLKQTQRYMLHGGKTFSGLIPCWVNAPSELQPAHKYHGKNVVVMHENNGGFRCVCIDDEKPITFHLPEDTLFAEGWRKKPAEWSKEDEKILDSLIRLYSIEYSEYVWPWANGAITYGDVVNFLKSLRPQSKEELAKMLQDEYNKGKETGEREGYTKGYNKGYKDANGSVSYHFPVMPTPSSGFGCDGIHCTNPQMDCINCPKKSTGGMFNTASSSGDLTLKADWKPSEDEERLITTSISFLKDFADKGYENAVECIDLLKSKLNGNTGK